MSSHYDDIYIEHLVQEAWASLRDLRHLVRQMDDDQVSRIFKAARQLRSAITREVNRVRRS